MQLLQFAEPIEKEKIIYFDRRPEANKNKSPGFKPSNIISPKNQNNNFNTLSSNKYYTYRKNNTQKKDDFYRNKRRAPVETKKIVIQASMFPVDQKEINLNEDNKYLSKQKEELIELYENLLVKINEQDKLRDEEIRLHTNNMNSKLKNFQNKSDNLKKNNYLLTKKFMDLKYDTNQNNQKIKDEIEVTNLQGQALNSSIAELKKRNKYDKEVNKRDFDRKTREVGNFLRKEVKTKEETSNIATRQFNDIQKMYEDKINEAKYKYRMAENKYNLLKDGIFNEEERANDIKEIEKNINYYRNKMKEFEKYINDIKKLTQGDYNHYLDIFKKTLENNQNFLNDTQKIEEELINFELILNEKHEQKMLLLQNKNDFIGENGEDDTNNKDRKYLIDSENKIIEEEDEKMLET